MNGLTLWLAMFALVPLTGVALIVMVIAAARKNPAVWCSLLVRTSEAAIAVMWWWIRLGESCDAFAARWCELKRLERDDSNGSKQLKALEGK